MTGLGWESLKEARLAKREANPFLAAIGYFITGVFAGVLSLLVLGGRVLPETRVPGLSLVLSPLGTGIAMQWIGEFWEERGRARPALFTFASGAVFAFAMALVRFVHIELGWSPF